MWDFIEACLAPTNIAFTAMLVLCAGYWLLVIAGGLSMDALDTPDFDAPDVGSDLDLDVDADFDANVSAPPAHHHGWADTAGAIDVDTPHAPRAPDTTPTTPTSLRSGGLGLATLRFLNLGDVPLMIVLSVLTLAAWAIGVTLHPFIGGYALWVQFLALIPILLIAALIAKVVTQPLKLLFRKLREEERHGQHLTIIGQRVTIASHTAGPTHGQAHLPTTGSPVLLNVQTPDHDTTLKQGQEAVVVRHDPQRNVYIVRGF